MHKWEISKWNGFSDVVEQLFALSCSCTQMWGTAAAVATSTPSLQSPDPNYAPYLIHANADISLNQSSVCGSPMLMPAQTSSAGF